MNETIAIYAAPMQGYTQWEWRTAHAAVYPGSIDRYYAPFVRMEKGEPRTHDMRDITMIRSDVTVPQIIFKDYEEWKRLTDAIVSAGYTEIDMNMGCPFAPQVKRGRGAGVLLRPDELDEIAGRMSEYHGIRFSVKMRVGVELPEEWRGIIRILDRMPLEHITLHPRTARQQYGGDLYLEEANALIAETRHPVIINGDINSPDEIDRMIDRLPGVRGVMLGRGLQRRPSLAAEWRTGREWTRAERLEAMSRLHEMVSERLGARLCGNHQLLSRLRPFWDYAEPEIGRRIAKSIRKATTLAAYQSAVALIANEHADKSTSD